MEAAVVHTLGNNKGAPRLWLQGEQPLRAEFKPGVTYSVDVQKEKNMVVLKVTEKGERVVSKKDVRGREVPVIDLNSNQVLGLFAGMEKVRVILSKKDRAIYILPLASKIRVKERLDRLMGKLKSGQPLDVGSISTGGGILDHAFHQGMNKAGIKTRLVFANDIDVETLEHTQEHNEVWDKDTQFLGMPMQELAFDEYVMSKLRKCDVLAAGIPCAAHSVAARAKKQTVLPEDDPIFGHLVVAFLSIVARSNASVLLLENVEPYQSSASMSIIRNQLRDMGYIVHERILEANDWNCLEARVRMCMVAVTEGIEFNFDDLLVPPKVERRLGEIMDDVPLDAECWRSYDYLKSKEVRDAAKGNSFNMQLFDENSDHISTLRKFYHKGGSTDPLLKHPTNPDLLRQLSANEHARCKEIPEHLIEGMSKTAAHELLGQSVAHPPFVAVGELIGKSLNNWSKTKAILNQIVGQSQQDLLAA